MIPEGEAIHLSATVPVFEETCYTNRSLATNLTYVTGLFRSDAEEEDR
jgi:hypothetical protein